MPRPRKNDPTPLIRPLLTEFAEAVADTVERLTLERVRAIVDGHAGRGARVIVPRGPRAKVFCYYPGCKNVAAPRFGMFCAALHKNLSVSEKEKYRKQHLASVPGATPAKRGRRRK